MPAVSVLIPARNAAVTVEEALASIAAQTFRDWEALVVDDGSTDATPQLLEAWSRRDPRFRVLRSEASAGISAALNRAIEAAESPLLARMDADDVALPRRLELQVERITTGEVAAVGGFVRYFPEERVMPGARRYEAWLNSLVTPEEHERDLFVECPLAHPTMLLRAEAVKEVGGYRAPGWPEDYDLLLRLSGAGYRMAKVPETLLLWREGEARASRTRPEYSLDAFTRCKAHFLAQRYFAEGRPALVFGAGPTGKALARALMAEGVTLAGFVDLDPRKIGQEIYGTRVLDQQTGLARRGEVFGLAAVGKPEARALLRETLEASGWVEGRDFRAV